MVIDQKGTTRVIHISLVDQQGKICIKCTMWLQNSHRRIGKQSLSELAMEMAHKLFALRPVLKKNVFTLDKFYKCFHNKLEPQNFYSNMTY